MHMVSLLMQMDQLLFLIGKKEILIYEEVGPKYDLSEIRRLPFEEPVVYEDSIEGMIEIMDPNFGNLWTNIPKKMFEDFGFKYGDKVKTVITYKGEEVFNQELPYFKSFSYAQDHSLMIYHNELNKIALAEVVGNMARNYNLGYGTDYKVVFMR